jgi:hypothetical protein
MTSIKTIHIVYDVQYLNYLYAIPHLRNPFNKLGHMVFEYFVNDDDVVQKTDHIPKNDPNHIIFMHIGKNNRVIQTCLETLHWKLN